MLVAQSCLTLCNPMDCSLPGASVHEIFQARVLKWVAISSSRESSLPRNRTHVSCIGRWILYRGNTREAPYSTWKSWCSLWDFNKWNIFFNLVPWEWNNSCITEPVIGGTSYVSSTLLISLHAWLYLSLTITLCTVLKMEAQICLDTSPESNNLEVITRICTLDFKVCDCN